MTQQQSTMVTHDTEIPTIRFFFHFTQIMYGVVGIHPCQTQNARFGSFNWRNTLALLSFVTLFVASTAFLLFAANTFVEYSKSYQVPC